MSTKPHSPWTVLKQSLSDFRDNWQRYVLVVAAIILPLVIISVTPGLSATDAQGNTTSVAAPIVPYAFVVMNVVLLWVIAKVKTGSKPTLAQAYYEGSAPLIRYVLVGAVLVVLMIPAFLGFVVYAGGYIHSKITGSPTELLIYVPIALVLAAISGWWMVRFALAPLVLITEDKRPVAALKHSRMLSLRRFWWVAAHLAALLVISILLCVPVALVAFGIIILKHFSTGVLFFETVVLLGLLPFTSLYLFNLYRSLSDTFVPIEPKARDKKAKKAQRESGAGGDKPGEAGEDSGEAAA